MHLLYQKKFRQIYSNFRKIQLGIHIQNKINDQLLQSLYQVNLSHHSSEHFLLNLKFHMPEVRSARSGVFQPLNIRHYKLYYVKLSKLLICPVTKAKNKQQPKTTFWILVVWSLSPFLFNYLVISYLYYVFFFFLCCIPQMAFDQQLNWTHTERVSQKEDCKTQKR